MSQLDMFAETLNKARARVMSGLDSGIECPCCGQYAKLYRRKLNSGMARSLVWLVRHHRATGLDWIDVPKVAPRYVVNSREFGKLEHWRLTTRSPETHEGKKFNGLWRATTRGFSFVDGLLRVPSHALLYINRLKGLDGDDITIREALGSKFDYDELMSD